MDRWVNAKVTSFLLYNNFQQLSGFLTLDDPELNVPGNAALKDQLMAMKWIKNNIQYFGGDANNITLFGHSAGGCSAHYHCISEKSKGKVNLIQARKSFRFF